MLGQRMNRMISAALMGGWLVVASPLALLAVDVSDAGHFFSTEAIEKANQSIREIEKKSGHEIRIETHATVPSDKLDSVKKMDRAQRQEFMHDWAKERAKDVKENGTLILICKDPANVQTWFNGKLKDEGMTKTDRDEVSEAFLTGLKAKDNDAALRNGVARLGEAYANLTHISKPRSSLTPAKSDRVGHGPVVVERRPVPQAHNSGWNSVLWIGGMVLLAMFAVSLISRMFSGGGNAGMGAGYGRPGGGVGGGYGYPGGYGGGGGGFLSSLAGGIFGAAAGNWIYDAFSGRSAHAHDPYSTSAPPMDTSRHSDGYAGSDSSGADSGWTDEGSSSGGGWFDGGDSGGGGGDFGGGDSGGGDF